MNIAQQSFTPSALAEYWSTSSFNNDDAYVWDCDISPGFINKALLKQESHPYYLDMYALKVKTI